MKLTYESPLDAVFLRVLAWEWYVAGRQLAVKDVTKTEVQAARMELGLTQLESSGGAADDYLQRLRDKQLLSAKLLPPKPLDSEWRKAAAWRLYYLPPHDRVRQLSAGPVVQTCPPRATGQTYTELLLTLRNPAVPTLRICVGPDKSVGKAVTNLRGVYFIREPDALYIGKSDEFQVRLGQHDKAKTLRWSAFVAPESIQDVLTQDTQGAADALLISFWNEITYLSNDKRGTDRSPAFQYLQQAILFTEAASAALLWLIRDGQKSSLQHKTFPSWSIPFRVWKGRGWPECYMKVPGN
ncbi:MAG: hypothetical protein IT317_15965 [Anaerolineales bacterium]|nr:hypothetical protein [Anaerolineales bacterium]